MRMIIFVACLWLATPPLWGKIVFDSRRSGNHRSINEIYTMNSDGSNLTQLTFTKNNTNPAWSPNGKQIVFQSKRDGNWEIYVMDADGTNQRRLTHHPGFDYDPDWSPDGFQIAFDSNRNAKKDEEKAEIYVMDADGGNVKQVTDVGLAARPRWSPDGQWILFQAHVKGIVNQGRQIYAIRPDGTDLWQVSNPRGRTWRIAGGWSPDGKKILYIEKINNNDGTPVIATRHPTPKRQRVLKRVQVKIPLKDRIDFSFSADGKSLLFAAKRHDDHDWDIYRFRLADRQLIQLTNNQGSDNSQPREWNPRLSVSPQELTSTLWGEIKTTR